MSTAFFLVFLATLVTTGMTKLHCCDDVKNEITEKTSAYRILCSNDSRLSANCCKEIEDDIKEYQMAYNNLCPKGSCPNPYALGMESGKIPDSAITASSMWSSSWKPYYGRLRKKIGGCAWLAASGSDPAKSWLQVDFGAKMIVTGVATQGSCVEGQWAKSYVIWYSDNAVNWKYYSEGGARTTFQGNKDQNTVVTNTFKDPIVARYVRITAQPYSSYAEIRVEYYGCRL